MRLVDADVFKAEGRELYREAGWDLREVHYSQMDVECNIDMMPTIEAVPKHGRWEKKSISIKGIEKEFCSECKTWSYGRSKAFCPNCGADMRGEKDG